MPVTATIITDRRIAEAPWIRVGRDGSIAQRNYLVTTHDEARALEYVPAYGSSWNGDLPNLQLVAITGRYFARKDSGDAVPASGGLTIVQCDYATPGAGGFLPPPVLGYKFTQLGYQTETVTVMYDVRGGGFNTPIANGEGAAKLVGVSTARVTAYVALNQAPDWARLRSLTNNKNLNLDAIELPPVPGTTNPIPVPALAARYEGFDPPSVKNNLLEVVHVLTLAGQGYLGLLDPFDFLWRAEDKQGKAVGPVIGSHIYEAASFTNLW